VIEMERAGQEKVAGQILLSQEPLDELAQPRHPLGDALQLGLGNGGVAQQHLLR